MKNLLRVAPWIASFVLLCFGSCTSFACTVPPAESKSSTWIQLARVGVTFDNNLNLVIGNAPAPITTAVNNWNTGTQLLCRAAVFTFGAGTGPTMSFAYNPIPNKPDGTLYEGKQ
jgi:hypothetical protein